MTGHMTIHLDADTVAALERLRVKAAALMDKHKYLYPPTLPELARTAINRWCEQQQAGTQLQTLVDNTEPLAGFQHWEGPLSGNTNI